MASNDTHFESLLNRVREKLKRENIKLWLPPYTSESEDQGSFPEVRILYLIKIFYTILPQEFKGSVPCQKNFLLKVSKFQVKQSILGKFR